MKDRHEVWFTEGDGGEPRKGVECTWGALEVQCNCKPKSAIMVYGHDSDSDVSIDLSTIFLPLVSSSSLCDEI